MRTIPMHTAVTACFLAVTLAFSTAYAGPEQRFGVWDGKMHVVYHVSDENKVNFVLGNIRNHIKGVGDPAKLDIVLVIHGPALKAFHAFEALDAVKKKVASLEREGVHFMACGNTMAAQGVKKEDLLSGFEVATRGGVVKIAELQSQGYLYIRP